MLHPIPSEQNQMQENTFAPAAPLSESFLSALVAELDTHDVVGIIVAGSYSRGEATQYSDVDLAYFVKDAAKLPSKRFFYHDGRLVSLAAKRISDVRRSMTQPNTAIFVVPGFHHSRILLDKDGSVSQFLHEVETFAWQPLQEAANSYASFAMMLLAEWIHKILSEILKENDLGLSTTLVEFIYTITEIVAVQRGILIKTTSTYYQQVQNDIGQDSAWTRYHLQVAGIVSPSTEDTSVRARAIAALHLYLETFKLLQPILDPDHFAVAEQATKIAQLWISHNLS